VFAARGFRAGERVLVGDESRVVSPDNPLRPELGEDGDHCDYLAGGKVVLLGFPERHVNHSCHPNAYVKYVDGVRGTHALRDIAAGEEITHDYCINGFGDMVWRCNCGSPRCRKWVHVDFFHLPLELQIEYLPLLTDWYVEEYRKKVDRLKRRIAKQSV
jgi:hypothetical protein